MRENGARPTSLLRRALPARLGSGSTVRSALRLLPALLAVGCEAASPERVCAIDPESGVLRLMRCPAEVEGGAPPEPGWLARWTGESVAAWTVEQTESGVKIASPDLEPRLAESALLRLRLAPGGATRVRITPILAGRERPAMQRNLRSVVVNLERDADPDVAVWVEAGLTDAIRGNWDDEVAEIALERLEIGLPGAVRERVRLEEIALDGPDAAYAGAVAAARAVEHAGIIRPAWYLHGGARVRFAVAVPEADPELRWHDGGAGERAVRVLDGREGVEIARHTGSGPWRHRSVSLSRWAGRRVRIELAVGAGGLGFFGDPRVVSRGEPGSPPCVVLYMIDTLRADRVGAWGSGVSTPVFDRLADEGLTFSRAISTSSWTKPAIVTLMTGISPTTHRVGAERYTDRLPESVAMVQERFREAGWRTGSFSSNPLGSTLSALERGFGTAVPPRYWRGRLGPLARVSADQLHAALLDWLDEEPDRPSFAYVHTLEVHESYKPLYAAAGAQPLDRYDAAVRDADRKLGDLLQALGPRRSDLTLVLVSDHGHSFGDYGVLGHGTGLFQSQIHIPLIFWSPGRIPAMRVDRPVSLADVAPTLLELTGLAPLPEADGCSLAARARGDRGPERGFVGASLLRFVWAPEAPQQFALVSDDLRKVIRSADGRVLRFDVGADPTERRPLGQTDDSLERALQRWIEGQEAAAAEFRERHGGAVSGVLDAEASEQLRALGYLE